MTGVGSHKVPVSPADISFGSDPSVAVVAPVAASVAVAYSRQAADESPARLAADWANYQGGY